MNPRSKKCFGLDSLYRQRLTAHPTFCDRIKQNRYRMEDEREKQREREREREREKERERERER